MVGPEVSKQLSADGEFTISVGKSETGYSEAIKLVGVNDFALEYKVACTATPNVKIFIQQKSEHANAEWATPDTYADVNPSLTDKNQHNCRLALAPLSRLRICVTEQSGTVNDTIVTFRLSVQKKFAY